MSTITKSLGRVSIVPKGLWSLTNSYERLDIVSYNGNSYIAKQDVPANTIQITNTNYWMLIAERGQRGEAAGAGDYEANKNYLINSYFIGGGSQQGGGQFPINSRQQLSYSEKYNIDEWMLSANNIITVTLNNDYIRLTRQGTSGNPAWVQIIPDDIADKVVTISMLYRGNITHSETAGSGANMMVTSGSVRLESSADWTLFTTTRTAGTRTFGTWENKVLVGIQMRTPMVSTDYIDIKAIKIELGDTQTLAHQENGVWILNELPNYQEELIKCGYNYPNSEDQYLNYMVEQKRISILGDSISTFQGYSPTSFPGITPPSGETYVNYPNSVSGSDVTDVNQTWWKKVIDALGGTLEKNASAGRSRATTRSGYPNFYSRANVTSLGYPNYIFVELGTNDSSGSVSLGSYDYTSSIENLSESTFRTAYIKGIKNLQLVYPSAKICLIILKMTNDYANSIKAIGAHFNCTIIDARGYTAYDGTHPNAQGMNEIATTILRTLNENVDVTLDYMIDYGKDHYILGNDYTSLGIQQISPSIDLQNLSDGNKYGYGFQFYDKNEIRIANVRPYLLGSNASGQLKDLTGVQLTVERYVETQQYLNELRLGITPTGDQFVGLTNSTPWLTALHLTPKIINPTISNTLPNGVTINNNQILVIQTGYVVQVYTRLNIAANQGNSSTILATGLPPTQGSTIYSSSYIPHNQVLKNYDGVALTLGVTGAGQLTMGPCGTGIFFCNFTYITSQNP